MLKLFFLTSGVTALESTHRPRRRRRKGERAMTTTKAVKLVVRCRPFLCEGFGKTRVLVEPDGQVRVWDDVARSYTSLHHLSPRSIARIRYLARKAE